MGVESLVLGIDGCPGGWVVVAGDERTNEAPLVFGQFEQIIERHPDAAVMAVDIPIGLPTRQDIHREADGAARAVLGKRRVTVFMTWPREVLMAPTYPAAKQIAQEMTGKKCTFQSYGMARRILEVDALLDRHPGIHEIHPEVCFWAMNSQRPVESKKREPNGQEERKRLLASNGMPVQEGWLKVRGADPDDVLDAMAALWSARRIARGEALALPPQPPVDGRGRKVAIWY